MWRTLSEGRGSTRTRLVLTVYSSYVSVPSPGTMAAFATTLIVFGVVGWTTGWLVASGEQTDLGGPTPGPTVTQEPTKRAPSPTPPPTPSPTRAPAGPCATPANAFAMPNLVGQQYMEARRKGLSLGVTVNVHFNQEGNRLDGIVVGTNPEKDVCYLKGSAISLYVTGPVPKVKVPEVLGLMCKPNAVAKVIDVGLTIDDYPGGDKGRVYKTEPSIGTELPWNAKVKLYCSESASPGTVTG